METNTGNTSSEGDERILTPTDMQTKGASVTLELGDIIEIIAPSNPDIHEMNALITYIDIHKLKLINVVDGRIYQLLITEDGHFTDESISQIHLLSRSEEKGYARQNELLPRTWIDIHFGGEIPAIITGEITNLEEDMIEVTTYPERKTIFINFGYRGIPEDIPITSIVVRNKPTILKDVPTIAVSKPVSDEEETDEPEKFVQTSSTPSVQFTETGESIISIPADAPIDANIRDTLHDLYIEANNIIFGYFNQLFNRFKTFSKYDIICFNIQIV